MQLIETLRMIIINLVLNKFKVLLTSLGIIIGTLTIIMVIAIGQGGEKQIADQFANMSAETIYVNINYRSGMNYETIPHLKLEHLDLILEENPYLKNIYLRASTYKEVMISGEKKNRSIAGVSYGYADISNFKIQFGDDFTEEDMENEKRYVVLGNKVASEYFGSLQDAIGEKIIIGNYRYEIIGVLEKKSEGLQGLNPDESIFVPYQSAINDNMLSKYDIPQMVGLAKDTKVIAPAIKRLKGSIDFVLEDSSMYSVEDAGSRIDAATQSARTMKMILISVAIIVFIVGGIGIMNVLFVSVKERTREIGVLKALGASQKDILLQFLLESIGIGFCGGLIGVCLQFVAFPILKYTQIPMVASVEGPILAMLFAIVTSGLFGFYPAYKASLMKPIEALSYE